MEWCELNLTGSVEGPVVGSCKHCNEPSGSTECREFLDERALASKEGVCSMELVALVREIVIPASTKFNKKKTNFRNFRIAMT
jgi:hypothetical protein